MADNNMGMEERGRNGGQATAEKHDKEYYQEIEKGGDMNHDKGYQNGQNGTETPDVNYDQKFYQRTGQTSGETISEKQDKEFDQRNGGESLRNERANE